MSFVLVTRHVLFLTCFLVLLLPTFAKAQAETAKAAFAEGNARYEAGSFAEALTAYRQAEASGFTSAALMHNMGGAHYRLGQLGLAIRYFERARRLAPDDPRVLASLNGARLQTEDAFPVLPRPFYQSRFDAILLAVGATGFFTVGILLYFLAIGLAGYALWHRRWKAALRRSLLLMLPLALLLIGLAFLADAPPEQLAVVLIPEIAVREAPAPSAEIITTLHEGTTLDVLTLQGDWLHARLPTGTTGWLPAMATGDV